MSNLGVETITKPMSVKNVSEMERQTREDNLV